MNFKDAYKSCNDEISGNREILASVLSGETKKKAYKFRPVLACAAMILLVVSVAFLGFDTIDISQHKPTRVATTDGIHTTPPAETKTEDIGSSQSGESVTTENKDTLTQAQTNLQMSDVEKADTEAVGKAAPTPEPPMPYEPSEKAEYNDDGISVASMPSDNPAACANEYVDDADAGGRAYTGDMPEEPMIMPDTEALNDSDVMHTPSAASSGSSAYGLKGGSGGGGGGSAGAAISGSASGQIKSSVISLESYFDYLGINIIQKALLPSDMSFEDVQNVNVRKSDDAIVSDNLSVSAYSSQNSGRYLTLTVSRTSGLAKSYVSGTNVPTVTGDDTSCIAYMMAGDISVSVTARNVTKDEINRLISSLKN